MRSVRGRVEVYELNGEKHRLDGPAETEFFPNGVAKRERYFVEGQWHREDGPAEITRTAKGVVMREAYHLDGRVHRIDGPAEIEYALDGTLHRQRWWVDGRVSRIDGPAEVTGLGERFYFRDQKHDDLASVRRALLLRPVPEIEQAIRASKYAPLLDEGITPRVVAKVIAEGVSTPEGVRAVVFDGAPVEWARSFEESLAD